LTKGGYKSKIGTLKTIPLPFTLIAIQYKNAIFSDLTTFFLANYGKNSNIKFWLKTRRSN